MILILPTEIEAVNYKEPEKPDGEEDSNDSVDAQPLNDDKPAVQVIDETAEKMNPLS